VVERAIHSGRINTIRNAAASPTTVHLTINLAAADKPGMNGSCEWRDADVDSNVGRYQQSLGQFTSVKQNGLAFFYTGGWLLADVGASKRATVYVYNAQFLESLKLHGSQSGLIDDQSSCCDAAVWLISGVIG